VSLDDKDSERAGDKSGVLDREEGAVIVYVHNPGLSSDTRIRAATMTAPLWAESLLSPEPHTALSSAASASSAFQTPSLFYATRQPTLLLA
jgi:hypothetical protein